MKTKLIAATSIAAVLVAGCAENQQVDLNLKNVSNVHRVTVLGPSDPVPLAVRTQTEDRAEKAMSAAAAIPFAGLLGAAVAGGVAGGITAEVEHETSKPLNQAAAAENYRYAAAMQGSLVTALKADGYDVSTASIAHKPGLFAEKLDGAGRQTDLLVDAVASATCTNIGAGHDAHFRPVVILKVRLTRPGQTKPIMNRTFVYDDAVTTPDAFNIKGDPQYDVADYGALKSNINLCLNGIKASAAPLARAVAQVVGAPPNLVAAN